MATTVEVRDGERVHSIPVDPPAPPARNRFGSKLLLYWKKLFGTPSQRRLAKAALFIPQIRYFENELEKLNDTQLKERSAVLRQIARGGKKLDSLLPEVFGLVCVLSKRTLNMRPYDVQLAGGAILHFGGIAELATGEGKTLTATLPVALNGLTAKGVHVTTVNDYLAKRDAEILTPIYGALGLTVGCLQQQMPDNERQKIYRYDITYGTASDFGFDFLRDRLKFASSRGQDTPFWGPWTQMAGGAAKDNRVQRENHYYAMVDEADNIFIDEARTPLIIANAARPAKPEECIVYNWADRLSQQMVRDQHFTFDEKKQKLELTDAGRGLVRYSNPPVGPHSHAMDKLHEHVERALQAQYRFRKDQHYLIEKGKVVLIDEATGRKQPDRHWREGLHQAVEAKEGVQITMASDHAAQITYQSYFKLYKKLSGMTGTAASSWMELLRVYKLWVVQVPTNRPCIREHWPDRVFPNEETKFTAVAHEVKRLRDLGRAVLIGTKSVEKSEKLSAKLTELGIEHQVLNCKFHEMEAKIVEHAGEWGKVMIATNMAGRGTDIKLDARVRQAGGLHVLGTERHESPRVDRQLVGRAGRQGDPGSAQFFLSLDDELLEGLGADRQAELTEIGQDGSIRNAQKYMPEFVKAQKRIQKRHYRQRVDLMVYEKNRQEILKDLAADPYVD